MVQSPPYESPIRTPGSIQSYGALLVLAEPNFKILQVSRNIQQYLGYCPQQIKEQPLQQILDAKNFQIFQAALPQHAYQQKNFQLSILVSEKIQTFNAFLHRTNEALILEIEPAQPPSAADFSTHQELINETIALLQYASTPSELLQIFVNQIRSVTGFDRVHIYRFDAQEAGEVVVEAKRDDLSTYVGLHFPEMDIPRVSRELYAQGLLRYIPNIDAQPVKITPIQHPQTRHPLDLGASLLRSVDPCCVEYYRNMGSVAALVISMCKDGKLWGLLSCHHQTPKVLTQDVRSTCALLTHIATLELGNKLRQEELDARRKLNTLHTDVIKSIARADNFVEALIHPGDRLLDLVNAQGAAICLGSEISLVGQTPLAVEVQTLIDFLEVLVSEDIFYTDFLVQHYPEGSAFKEVASGLLLLWISRAQRYCIIWFRPEVLQSVNWGGKPEDSFQLTPEGKLKLGPRQSFDLWQEQVEAHSLPWQSAEIESAQNLKSAIVGIVLKKAEELAKLNQELAQSNRELAAFSYSASHDLKEPLRGIYNYASILQEDYSEHFDEEGLDYLLTIMRLSQRMDLLINGLLRLAQLRQEDLTLQMVDLNQLVTQVIEMLNASRPEIVFEVRIPKPLPTIHCAPDLIREVFSNLIRNAIKYNDSAEKWIEIGAATTSQDPFIPPQTTTDDTPTVFYIRDNGIGIRPQHQEMIFKLFKRLHGQDKYGGGAGAGLAIVKQIIERHGGWIWVESTYGEGTTFYFTLN